MNNSTFLLKFIKLIGKVHHKNISFNPNNGENALDKTKLCIYSNEFQFYVMIDNNEIDISNSMSGVVFYNYKIEGHFNTYSIIGFSLHNNEIDMIYVNDEGRLYINNKFKSNFRIIDCDSKTSAIVKQSWIDPSIQLDIEDDLCEDVNKMYKWLQKKYIHI